MQALTSITLFLVVSQRSDEALMAADLLVLSHRRGINRSDFYGSRYYQKHSEHMFTHTPPPYIYPSHANASLPVAGPLSKYQAQVQNGTLLLLPVL